MSLTKQEEELLYTNNLGRRTFQWELWQCCNNLCKFCYIGRDNRHTDKERQLKSLSDLKKSLERLDYEKYNNVALIGGEFFQGQLKDEEVRRAFFDTIDMIADLYVDQKIGSIWISATLTIGEQEDLYEMIDVFDKAGVKPHPDYGASGLWICTSWDPEGRFHTKQNEDNWKFHMKNMTKNFPWVKKNTTIILTQKFCEMYLAEEYSAHKFMEEYGTKLFYKPPGLLQDCYDGVDGLPSFVECAQTGRTSEYLTAVKNDLQKRLGFKFFPERKTFRKFLVKYAKEDPESYNTLMNIEYRADELHRNFNEDDQCDDHTRFKGTNVESDRDNESIINPECRLEPYEKKHITYYASYADCNDCMICDRNQIWESVHGGKF